MLQGLLFLTDTRCEKYGKTLQKYIKNCENVTEMYFKARKNVRIKQETVQIYIDTHDIAQARYKENDLR